MGDGPDLTPPDPDSRGCLFLVTSFVGAARTIEEVTTEAAKRVMMSPVLSDFIELRFADLGPQPGEVGDRSAAIRRVTDALLTPPSAAGHNYFAVVMVDRSATVAEQVLCDCSASPFLTPLRARFLGISNSDDRSGSALAEESGGAPEIVTSPTGVWSKKEELVDVLRQFADELQRYFSAGHEPGLSVGELGELKARFHHHAAQQLAGSGASPAHTTQASGVTPDACQARDMLADDPSSAPTSGAHTPEGKEDKQTHVPTDPQEQPGPDAPQPDQYRQPLSHPAGQDTSASPPGPSEPAGLASRSRRWFSELRRRRGQQFERGESEASTEDADPKTERLVYLIIVGDATSRDEAALSRSRSAVRAVDKKLAELPGFAYQVRMLHGDEDGLRSDLRDAGQLSRRHVRRTVADVDFAAVLEDLRASLKRDGVTLKAVGTAARPAVVFFTPEPPLADSVAADLFRDLAREASIIWALPRSAKPLLSKAFTDSPGVQVIADDQAVADEIAALLSSAAGTAKAGA
jgi:hypothetical protein